MALQQTKTKLKNVAQLQLGYSFRSRITPNNRGKIRVVQQKDLSEDNYEVSADSLLNVSDNQVGRSGRYTLEATDLIFRSRGRPLTVLAGKHAANAVLAAPLMKIRITSDSLLPEYLLWFLNSGPTLGYLLRRAKGTQVQHIDITTLMEVEVPIVSKELQSIISNLSDLFNQEYRLESLLLEKRRLFHSRKLTEIVSRGV